MKLNRIVIVVFVLLVALLSVGFGIADRSLQQPDKTLKFLESQGFTDIQVTGWDWIAADKIWRPST